jgi:hypothetical protein
MKTIVAAVVLLAFTVFSAWVVATRGYFGFLTLAGHEPWALQLLIDLTISLTFAIGWMRADARKHGLDWRPYALATPAIGSIAILAYVARRGLLPAR